MKESSQELFFLSWSSSSSLVQFDKRILKIFDLSNSLLKTYENLIYQIHS